MHNITGSLKPNSPLTCKQWHEDEVGGMAHPLIRLDFILMSKNLYFQPDEDYFDSIVNDQTKKSVNPSAFLHAGIDISNKTKLLSDHYPVFASWIPTGDNNDTIVPSSSTSNRVELFG
jgi:hypothetical protein